MFFPEIPPSVTGKPCNSMQIRHAPRAPLFELCASSSAIWFSWWPRGKAGGAERRASSSLRRRSNVRRLATGWFSWG
jgi:hypothetical protein